MTPITNREVFFKTRGREIIPVNNAIGRTRMIYSKGNFELWHSLSTSLWDSNLRRRYSSTAAYRIVRRMGKGDTMADQKKRRYNVAFIMRVCLVGISGWLPIRDALIEQIDLLDNFASDKRRTS